MSLTANRLNRTRHQQLLDTENHERDRTNAGMKEVWIIAGMDKGKKRERVFDHKFVGTTTQALNLHDLLDAVAREPDCIPFLLQQLNTR